MKPKFLATLLLFIAFQSASAYNILVLCAAQSRSHFVFLNTLTTALLDRGHHVTELVAVPPAKHPNRTTFAIAESIRPFPVPDLTKLTQRTEFRTSYYQTQFAIFNCEKALKSEAAKQLLTLARDQQLRPKIDVVLFDYTFGQCVGGFAKEFGFPPIVAITAYGNPVDVDNLVGGPSFPSFVPHDVLNHSRFDSMTWRERLHNKLVYLIYDYRRWSWLIPNMDEQMKQFFGEGAATVEEISNAVAVALVNSHPVIQGARPQLPSVVEVGGLHVPPVKEIPAGELRNFVDSAQEGFILMSFGSVVRASVMESWRRRELMRAFGRLQPLKVVFKWEETWDSEADGPVPKNVFLSKWLPQNDILGHRNIRLFVMHGGLLSTAEIVVRSVPVLIVPLIVDQFLNANNLVKLNVAKILPYTDLREDSFYNAVMEVLGDEKYLKSVRQLSVIFNDQPQSPLERAVYWVEFVARHGGAPHLRSPGQLLPWVARWMVDDVLILAVLVSGIVVSVRFLWKLCIQVRTGTEKLKEE